MKYPKHLLVLVLINAAIILIILYFSDKFLITNSGGREYFNLRLSDQKPYKYISCQIKPIDLLSCQVNTLIENFPNPKDIFITPTKIPFRQPIPFRF